MPAFIATCKWQRRMTKPPSSLWPVDDDVTCETMEGFYRRLPRMAPAEALCASQLAVRGEAPLSPVLGRLRLLR